MLVQTLVLSAQHREIQFKDTLYKPYYSGKVTDREGEVFEISRFRYLDRDNKIKYFFWCRRGGATYALDFSRIKKITFNDSYDEPWYNYTPAVVELVDGRVFDNVHIGSSGSLAGWDAVFGSYLSLYMNYNMISTIEFFHDGTYNYCSFCTTIYFDPDVKNCVFDNTELETGTTRMAEELSAEEE